MSDNGHQLSGTNGRITPPPSSRPDPLADNSPLQIAAAFGVSKDYVTADRVEVDYKLRFENVRPHTLRHWRGQWYRFGGSGYQPFHEEHLRAELNEFIVNLWYFGKDGGPVRCRGKRGENADVEEMLRRLCQAFVESLPAWVDGRPGPDSRNILAARNGLVLLSRGAAPTLLCPPTPAFFTTNALEYDFDPDAPDPAEFFRFLDLLWPDDPQSIELLQEWLGYCLTSDTSHQKILLMVGPKRAGKGTLGDVETHMIGLQNVAGPTLSGLAANFGLQSLIGKQLAIISDARLSNRADIAVIVERLLTISGEGLIDIDRKNQPILTTRLGLKIMILTNELPRLSDASSAIVDRFLVLNLTNSWLGKEDHGLRDRLLAELPGILLWATKGARRLAERGRFVQPETSTDAVEQLRDLGSPVSAFYREFCGKGEKVLIRDLFDAWRCWCEEENHKVGSAASFGRDLRTSYGVTVEQSREQGRQRCYFGLHLTPSGQQQLSIWRAKQARKEQSKASPHPAAAQTTASYDDGEVP